MTKEIKDLQALINEKAKQRATLEVELYLKQMKDNTNVHALFEQYYLKLGEQNISVREALWDANRKIPKDMIEALTEKYIPEETKAFYDKIENMSAELSAMIGTTY